MGVFSTFWSDPLAGLKSIFTPSTPVTSDAGGPQSGYGALFGSGGDSLSSARVRAYGVDPVTGKLISPAYSAAAVAAGYNGQGQDFIDAVTSMVQNQYESDYSRNYNDLSLFGGGGSSPFSGGSSLVVLLVVLVIAFVFIKVVK
jgi:hypothetical protein